ncbi:MAG: hypothetical protein K0Q94_6443 [Paenibacillus sp.]|jgi:hypothetical protein|nr:hypothetical protein [Paenibacillus sp.]
MSGCGVLGENTLFYPGAPVVRKSEPNRTGGRIDRKSRSFRSSYLCNLSLNLNENLCEYPTHFDSIYTAIVR